MKRKILNLTPFNFSLVNNSTKGISINHYSKSDFIAILQKAKLGTPLFSYKGIPFYGIPQYGKVVLKSSNEKDDSILPFPEPSELILVVSPDIAKAIHREDVYFLDSYIDSENQLTCSFPLEDKIKEEIDLKNFFKNHITHSPMVIDIRKKRTSFFTSNNQVDFESPENKPILYECRKLDFKILGYSNSGISLHSTPEINISLKNIPKQKKGTVYLVDKEIALACQRADFFFVESFDIINPMRYTDESQTESIGRAIISSFAAQYPNSL